MGDYKLCIDGASRGNPGKAGAGFVVYDQSGRVVKEGSSYLGPGYTNNQAEYEALNQGLGYARNNLPDLQHLEIRSDSQLVCNQMSMQMEGTYRVRNDRLKRYHAAAKDLLRGVSHDVKWIPRDENGEADRLANQAIDSNNRRY